MAHALPRVLAEPAGRARDRTQATEEEQVTQTIYPYLLYHSCEDALDWLSRASGFEETLRYTGEAGYVDHAEMRLGDARIFRGTPGEGSRTPKEQGGET